MKSAVQILCIVASFGGLWVGWQLAKSYEGRLIASRRRSGSVHVTIAAVLLFAPAAIAYMVTFHLLMWLG
jgi:hypothetical protein